MIEVLIYAVSSGLGLGFTVFLSIWFYRTAFKTSIDVMG